MATKNKKGSGKKEATRASYRKDLDALFSNDGRVPDRFKDILGDISPDEDSEEGLWKARIQTIIDISDFRVYAKAMTRFVKDKQPFPDHEDFLIRCLDHPTEKVYSACLQHILDLMGRREFVRTTPIKNRIVTLRSVSEYPKTLEYLDQLEEKLD